jgi:hypothetical protein
MGAEKTKAQPSSEIVGVGRKHKAENDTNQDFTAKPVIIQNEDGHR